MKDHQPWMKDQQKNKKHFHHYQNHYQNHYQMTLRHLYPQNVPTEYIPRNKTRNRSKKMEEWLQGK